MTEKQIGRIMNITGAICGAVTFLIGLGLVSWCNTEYTYYPFIGYRAEIIYPYESVGIVLIVIGFVFILIGISGAIIKRTGKE